MVDLTNDDGSATTINDTILTASVTDAVGEFERITGMLHEDTNTSHIATLISGTLYFLELYKGRELNIINMHSKTFYSGCNKIRQLLRFTPTISKENRIVEDSTPQLFDMDYKKNVFNPTPMGGSTIKYQNDV